MVVESGEWRGGCSMGNGESALLLWVRECVHVLSKTQINLISAIFSEEALRIRHSA